MLEEAEAQPAMHLVEHHAKIEIPVCTENLIRDLVWINVTANPTAEWVARQITGAFPWDEAPRHLIRDRDRIYGSRVAGPSLGWKEKSGGMGWRIRSGHFD